MVGRGAKWGQTGGSESDHIQPRRSWQGGSQLFSLTVVDEEKRYPLKSIHAAAAAAKSLQSCPTLCDPRDSSPQGSPVPGILQANTGVGCHFLLRCMKVKSESQVTQSCPTLSDPMDCSLPGSSVHGIFQAGVLEWGAIAFSTIQILFSNKSKYLGNQMNDSQILCWVKTVIQKKNKHSVALFISNFRPVKFISNNRSRGVLVNINLIIR